MTEVVIAVAAKVSEYLVGPAIHLGYYLFCVGKLTRKLKKEKEKLISRKDDVTRRAEEAEKRTEKIEPAVEKWLQEVQSLLQDVENDLKKLKRANGHFCEFCPSWRRYRLSKQLEKKIQRMIELNNNSTFEKFSRLASLPTNITSTTDIMFFESNQWAFDKLLEALKDDNCHIICLDGMGGCGKTTLAKEVGKRALEFKLFDKVVFTVVSQTITVGKVQDDIADVLGLSPWQEASKDGRAKRLSLGFQNGGRILVILDDVWRELNLEDFGIPSDGNLKGCKILLTTRVRDLCSLMNGQKNVSLDLLSPQEAWVFLQKKAGIAEDSSLNSVAQEVAAECGGLPIAIQAIATTLKAKPLDSWKDALYKLKHSEPIEVHLDDKDAFKCIQYSYDVLRSEKARRLFLMCCIFPEDHEIKREDLFLYGVGLGLFGENGSFDDLRSRVNATLDHLLDYSLLMNSDIGDGCFKIHDVVLDFAKWKASQEDWFVIVDHEKGINSLALDGTAKTCSAISTWDIEEDQFPQQFDYPKLEILLLNSTNSLDLSQASFEGIKGVKVMALIKQFYHVTPLSLPQSTNWLTNLQTLRLVGYDLGDISFVIHLKRLVILDLHWSTFKSLPEGIEELKKLKMLDLRECSIIENFDEVIGRCSQLEELYVCGDRAFVGKNVDSQASLLEGASFQKLCRYELQMGNIEDDSNFRVERYRSCLYFGELYTSNISTSVKNLIAKAEGIHLQNLHGGCKSIFPEFVEVVGIMTSLIELVLFDCHEIEFFICLTPTQVSRFHFDRVFSMLVKLRLYNMNNLKHVCCGSLPPNIFQKLEQVDIWECLHLISIFPEECNLQNLRELDIQGCPMLTSLFSMSVAQSLSQLEEITIKRCSNLRHIIMNDEHNATDGRQEIFQASECLNSMFPKLMSLTVEGCDNLEYVLPIYCAQGLSQLQRINIANASLMKYVFGRHVTGGLSTNQNEIQIVLPQLQKMVLEHLMSLVSICPENYFPNLSSLKEITWTNCPKLANMGLLGVRDECEMSNEVLQKPQGSRVFSKASNHNTAWMWKVELCLSHNRRQQLAKSDTSSHRKL
ncbi:disease resistance protein UNI-like isoform X3 [Prosopis cineraria]|nr:disease resistance protein UNI-like isoform X3 [Prosopis cineraria]